MSKHSCFDERSFASKQFLHGNFDNCARIITIFLKLVGLLTVKGLPSTLFVNILTFHFASINAPISWFRIKWCSGTFYINYQNRIVFHIGAWFRMTCIPIWNGIAEMEKRGKLNLFYGNRCCENCSGSSDSSGGSEQYEMCVCVCAPAPRLQ